MKQLIRFAAYAILLVGTMIFGYLGKPTEMGLAIVASAMALVFADLERFKRFKGIGFEAELKEQIEAIVEKETEPLEAEDSTLTSPNTAIIDSDSKAVMDALHHSEFTWRYLPGIMKDSKLPKKTILEKLNWLTENGFVRRSAGSRGTIWSLTEDGRTKNVIDEFSVVHRNL